MAKLISLEGATVTVPAGWSATSGYGLFSINYYLDGSSYSYFGIGFDFDLIGDEEPYPVENSILYRWWMPPTDGCLLNGESFSINITDGTDATNQQLIQWFVGNNAVIEGGIWEEEKPSLIIKNPICLIGSKAKKVIVDNVNLTIDIWTKEVPETPDIPTDLTDYQVDVPSDWTATADYGTFNFGSGFNVSVNGVYKTYQWLKIGYSFTGGGLAPSSNTIACADANGFPDDYVVLTSSKPIIFKFIYSLVSGDMSSLIQWFVDNGATFTKLPHNTGGATN